jgi:uracil phosphoribosyltransferase
MINLSSQNSLLNKFLVEIRDTKIQKDRMRFRKNLERIGEIFAMEISKTLTYEEQSVTTPLGEALINLNSDKIVLGCILRASLPLHQGLLNYFDDADNAFVSAYRKHHKDGSFEVEVEYLSSANLDGKILIIADPMLATGKSMVLSYEAMLQKGEPKHTHFVSVIASQEGVDHVKSHMGKNATLWVAALDDELTAQAYIVPGLGDAGDLAFGSKED